MEGNAAQIAQLTARLAELERRTADEAAAIRAELDALSTDALEPVPVPSSPVPQPLRRNAAPDFSWLAGPRGLALAGGVVTLLGIAFVFALASSRGWIGPAVRCSIGGCVSVGLLVAALHVQRRLGKLAAAVAAAGAGVGGCYLTLYAASRGYHLLGTPGVWLGVCAIAAVAVVLALDWRSELLAVLGLATTAIAPPIIEGRLTGVGLGASLVAAAAALAVGQARRWLVLGGLSLALVLGQAMAYIVESRVGAAFGEGALVPEWRHRATAAVVATLLFAMALLGAVAYQRRRAGLDAFAAAFVAASLPLALLSVWRLLDGNDARGTALLLVGVTYAIPAAALWSSVRLRLLAELNAAFALLGVAIATATFLSNGGLLIVWTLEGLALTAVAARLDRRYQAAGMAYFALALVHAVGLETPPSHLFAERSNPAEHLGAVAVLVVALALAAVVLRGRELVVARLDLVLGAAAALLALYLVSLGLLEVSQWLGSAAVHAKFQRGETLVSSFWALVALGVLAGGLARSVKEMRHAGLALLALAIAKLFLFDLSQLSSLTRAASFLAVGIALLAGGFLVQRLAQRPLNRPSRT